jgi:hypothetical protein
MRKRVAAVVAACVLGVVGGTVAANAGADITSPETISALGTFTKQRYVDVGKQGMSPGDTVLFVEKLTDDSDGSDLGTVRIECTVHIGPWGICVGTFDISGRGQIVGEGMVPFGDVASFDVPVTGGTGEFANVRGEDHIEPVSDAAEHHTLDLLP